MTKKQVQATTSRELQRFALAPLMGFVVLISPALVRAEPGESVSSWYWQGGSPSVDTFDEPQYMPPPHYILRYEAPPDEFEEPFITVMPRRPDFQIGRPSRPRKPMARTAPQVSQPDSQVSRPQPPVGQSDVEASQPNPNTARPVPIKKYNR